MNAFERQTLKWNLEIMIERTRHVEDQTSNENEWSEYELHIDCDSILLKMNFDFEVHYLQYHIAVVWFLGDSEAPFQLIQVHLLVQMKAEIYPSLMEELAGYRVADSA